MKIRASVRKICEKCRLIRRRTKETFYHKGVYKKF